MTEYIPTHRITFTRLGQSYEVMLVDGVGYTRDEWKTETNADFALVNGEWLFQGQPFTGTVKDVGSGRILQRRLERSRRRDE